MRLTLSQKALLYAAFRACLFDLGTLRLRARVIRKCEELYNGWSPNKKTVGLWIHKWSANGDEFSYTETSREPPQARVRQIVAEMVRNGSQQWKGNAKKKMAVVTEAIKQLDDDKFYWKKLFASCQARYAWIGDNNGALYNG